MAGDLGLSFIYLPEHNTSVTITRDTPVSALVLTQIGYILQKEAETISLGGNTTENILYEQFPDDEFSPAIAEAFPFETDLSDGDIPTSGLASEEFIDYPVQASIDTEEVVSTLTTEEDFADEITDVTITLTNTEVNTAEPGETEFSEETYPVEAMGTPSQTVSHDIVEDLSTDAEVTNFAETFPTSETDLAVEISTPEEING
jgi:hypothetical protein